MSARGLDGAAGTRVRIYQLMVRHFGNTNETREPDGDLVTNGCGTFADINTTALTSLREMGFTHVWLTGVLEHASLTSYPGRPADDSLIVKGKAGSPYAIRDYFDVSPDYAIDPDRRLVEFRELLSRCEATGLRTLIDFVPNHVARSYYSDVLPELSFGREDDRGVFFARDNNFYYLGPQHAGGGPPVRLPAEGGEGSAPYDAEREFGRVTGNNVCSWTPGIHDWYETVKLNYGHDFTSGRDTGHLPGVEAPLEEVPDTWRKMDAVLSYWQEFGVDGFRADMAHMVPLEFWRWAIGRARARKGDSFFMAEAYDGDPSKLCEGNVEEALLECGFDAVYDSSTYQMLQGIYEGPKWANDLDGFVPRGPRFGRSVRYAENHDEVRVASPLRWGGHGMEVGWAASALLFALGSGPVMIYNGQEVGEPASGAAGFSGDDGRTTIFDYWSLPELAKWVNGHRYDGGGLSEAQRELREWYGRMLHACGAPGFLRGEFLPLNAANIGNPDFGRLPGEEVSGHWFYSFMRVSPDGEDAVLVAVNLHPQETLPDLVVEFPQSVCERFADRTEPLRFVDLLGSGLEATATVAELERVGLGLPDLPPCAALYMELR